MYIHENIGQVRGDIRVRYGVYKLNSYGRMSLYKEILNVLPVWDSVEYDGIGGACILRLKIKTSGFCNSVR